LENPLGAPAEDTSSQGAKKRSLSDVAIPENQAEKSAFDVPADEAENEQENLNQVVGTGPMEATHPVVLFATEEENTQALI
jgi:hypothetical protein